LQAATNIYAGYYLTAVALQGDVNGVSVIDKLDRINPNRMSDAGRVVSMLSLESLDTGLNFGDRVKLRQPMYHNPVRHTLSTEAFDPFMGAAGKPKVDPNDPLYAAGGGGAKPASKPTDPTKPEKQDKPEKVKPDTMGIGRDAIATAKEASSLAVGKILEVSMTINGVDLRIPTMVTLFPNVSDSESFAHILSLHEQSFTVKERWHDWRSGKIDFWSDFVMMRDIVKKHRRVLVKDKSGYYGAVTRQDRNNKIAAMQNGPSLAQASNILVFSSSTARLAEQQIGAQLKDFKVREAVFEKTKAILMFIVDRDREMVKIYHSGIEIANELSVRELKVANKSSGPDVAEILKAYQLGNAPSF